MFHLPLSPGRRCQEIFAIWNQTLCYVCVRRHQNCDFWGFAFKCTISAKTLSGLRLVVQRQASLVRKLEVFSLQPSLCNSFLSWSLFFFLFSPPPCLMCLAGTHRCIACSHNASAKNYFCCSGFSRSSSRPKDKKKGMKQVMIKMMMMMTSREVGVRR